MGLQAVIKSATKAAFSAIGDIATTMTLRVTTPGTYDPATGMDSGATTTDYPCVGVVLPASKGTIEAFDNKFVGGTLIEQNLRSVKLSADGLPVEPKGGDKLIVDGAEWNVIGATPLATDGKSRLMFTLGIQRG